MSSNTLTRITGRTDIAIANAAPYGGAAIASSNIDEAWPTGIASRQFDRMTRLEIVIAPLGLATVDLQTDLMENGLALGLAGVRVLRLEAAEANPGAVAVFSDAPSGNPWFALWLTGTTMNLAPGAVYEVIAPLAGSYPVSSGSRRFSLINPDAGNAATVSLLVAGVSA